MERVYIAFRHVLRTSDLYELHELPHVCRVWSLVRDRSPMKDMLVGDELPEVALLHMHQSAGVPPHASSPRVFLHMHQARGCSST